MNYLQHFSIEYFVVAMAGIILYLLYYVYSKDAYYSKNIRSVATVVEEINRELYYLKKSISDTQKSITTNSQRMNDAEIYQEIERSVYDTMQPLSLGLKQLEESINAVDMQMQSRLMQLESGIKQISIPTAVHGNDDEKILSLFKQGVSVETISKELHISQPEVEFVLKINKIK